MKCSDGRPPQIKSKMHDFERKAERRREAWRLRVQGLSMQAIAGMLNVSPSTIGRYVREGLEETVRETRYSVEQYRQLELERLDQLLARWLPIAVSEKLAVMKTDRKGNETFKEEDFEAGVKAVAVVLKIMERRARLLGLDAVEETVKGENMEVPLDQLAARLKERTPLLMAACAKVVEENSKS